MYDASVQFRWSSISHRSPANSKLTTPPEEWVISRSLTGSNSGRSVPSSRWICGPIASGRRPLTGPSGAVPRNGCPAYPATGWCTQIPILAYGKSAAASPSIRYRITPSEVPSISARHR